VEEHTEGIFSNRNATFDMKDEGWTIEGNHEWLYDWTDPAHQFHERWTLELSAGAKIRSKTYPLRGYTSGTSSTFSIAVRVYAMQLSVPFHVNLRIKLVGIDRSNVEHTTYIDVGPCSAIPQRFDMILTSSTTEIKEYYVEVENISGIDVYLRGIGIFEPPVAINSDQLDGKHSSDFALSNHTHTFISLTDTPSDYTGNKGKLLSVKQTEDGLEFLKPFGITSFAPKPPEVNDYVVPYASNGYTASTTLTLTAKRIYWIPFIVWATISISGIAVNVTTAAIAGEFINVGIYSSTDTNAPNTRLVLSAFDCSTTGLQTDTVSLTLQPGVYWVAISSDKTPSIRAIASLGAFSLALPSLGTAHTTYWYTTGTLLPTAPTSGYSAVNGSSVPAVGLLYSFEV